MCHEGGYSFSSEGMNICHEGVIMSWGHKFMSWEPV